MNGVNHHAVRAVSGVQNPDGGRVAVGIPRKYKNSVGLWNKYFTMNRIERYSGGEFDLRAGPENLANGGYVAIGVACEGKNRKGKKLWNHDLVADRVISHVVDRAGDEGVLSGNGPGRLRAAIRHPGECRNLRMSHSV